MKFSEIDRQAWDGLKPYLDTCMLPVTGLTGEEQPWEATKELERLRDVMDCIEIPYKGRVVTYPAFHYCEGEADAAAVNRACRRLKEAGFRYVIVISAHPRAGSLALADADLLLCPQSETGGVMSGADFQAHVRRQIEALWHAGAKQTEAGP